MGKSNMEERERENFLAAPRIGVISINRISVNSPLATPVWYNYVPGGDVTVLMGRESVKYQLILASGGFTLTAQNEQYPYGYVSVSGGATVDDSPNPDEILALARRYRPEPEARQFAEAHTNMSEEVLVRMRPKIWFSQDYTKS